MVMPLGSIDCEGFFGTFDFAEVDYVILPVNQQIDLRTGLGFPAAPGKLMTADAGNAESGLDLAGVQKAYSLKGQPAPGVVRWGGISVLPDTPHCFCFKMNV